MKHLLYITLFMVSTGVLYAGLTLPIDQKDVGVVPVSSYSGFSGDSPPDYPDDPSGIDLPSNAVPWSEFDFGLVEYVDLYLPSLNIISRFPCEFVPIIVQLGLDPWVIPNEPTDVVPIPEVPEPASCLLLAAGCLMLRRRR